MTRMKSGVMIAVKMMSHVAVLNSNTTNVNSLKRGSRPDSV